MTAKITIYTTGMCGYCYRAKKLLEDKGVEFTEIDTTFDAEKRREARERSGRNTVPQIWIGDTHVGGSDELYALDRAGKLDAMLGLK
ncbi:MAG: glutaredoxin 3 [Alphaproteobacteria bacterium]